MKKRILVVIPLAVLVLMIFGIYEYGREGIKEIRRLEEETAETTQTLYDAKAQMEEEKKKLIEMQEELESITAIEEQLKAEAATYQKQEAVANSEKFLKQKMLSSYLENQELLIAAQGEVLESIRVDANFLLSYEERDIKGEALGAVEDAVIDGLLEELDVGVAGDMAGTTAKEIIQSLAKDFSVDGLCSGISNGLTAGVQNVLQSGIQEQINSVVGFDVFGAADLISRLSGYEAQIPEYLASRISSQMQSDSEYLSAYLCQERLTKEDLGNMAAWFFDLGTLAEELYNQTDGSVDVRPTDWQVHNENLKEIYNRYCANEQLILVCEETLGVKHEEK